MDKLTGNDLPGPVRTLSPSGSPGLTPTTRYSSLARGETYCEEMKPLSQPYCAWHQPFWQFETLMPTPAMGMTPRRGADPLGAALMTRPPSASPQCTLTTTWSPR